jgi:hypothetical protein
VIQIKLKNDKHKFYPHLTFLSCSSDLETFCEKASSLKKSLFNTASDFQDIIFFY